MIDWSEGDILPLLTIQKYSLTNLLTLVNSHAFDLLCLEFRVDSLLLSYLYKGDTTTLLWSW